MRLLILIVLAVIALAILVPLLHLVLGVLVVAGGVIVVMAAWKVLFGAPRTTGVGGPPVVR
jgi:small neutral amino acid transporter SnatA (MarC family)